MQSKVEETEADDTLRLSGGLAPENKLSLDWLKIIENATAGLTADLETAKRGRIMSPIAFDGQERRETALVPAAISFSAPQVQEQPGGKLTKLAYSLVEPRHAPPQTLQAALKPYAIAAGLFVFVSGCALAFFAIGSPSPDVAPASASPSMEPPPSLVVQPEPRGARKGDFKGQAAKTAPSAPPAFAAAMTDPRESGEAAPADAPAQTWSETVEAFRQFVKTEVQKSSARTGNAR
jgi:hypothetical protein